MMNKSMIMAAIAAISLGACALTPEQLALRQAAEAQARYQLHLTLLAQCDPEAAALAPSPGDAAADSERAQTYRQKMNDPVLQRCYRMAWENHINQARLQAAVQEMHRRDYMERVFYPMFFGCRTYRGCYW